MSRAGTTAIRTRRARPVRFSVSTGLRLCGIADEPFCPGEKYSSASSTSVRCTAVISDAEMCCIAWAAARLPARVKSARPLAATKSKRRKRGQRRCWISVASELSVAAVTSSTSVLTAGSPVTFAASGLARKAA